MTTENPTGKKHIVVQGEDAYTIAARYGFKDEKKLLAANRELFASRKAEVLAPGDVLVIPDFTAKAFSAKDKSVNKFKLTRPRRLLKIPLKDHEGKPLEDVPWKIEVGNLTFQGRTDAQGIICEIPVLESLVMLTLAEQLPIQLRIGHLNPLRGAPDGGKSGVAQRLALLGFHAGDLDGKDEVALHNAIAQYELSKGWEPGECDGTLNDKLMQSLEEETVG